MSKRVTVYDFADKAIMAMNREDLKIFGQLKTKLMKADELHVIREVTGAYDSILRIAERWLLETAKRAYAQAAEETGKRRKNRIDRDWLLEYFEDTEPAVLYRFIPEWDRKKARLIEALAIPNGRSAQIDKALKYWTRQIGHFAISITDAARLQAFEDAGVKKVEWHSEHDPLVCSTCEGREGKVYPIDQVPDKPHPNCRCWLTAVLDNH